MTTVIIVATIVVVLVVIVMLLIREPRPNPEMARYDKIEELEQNPSKALKCTATVLWASYLQDYLGQSFGKFGIHLEIHLPDGTHYKHTKGNPDIKLDYWLLNRNATAYLKQGEVLPVILDRDDPRWVIFEFENISIPAQSGEQQP